jgi:hypothetical protein
VAPLWLNLQQRISGGLCSIDSYYCNKLQADTVLHTALYYTLQSWVIVLPRIALLHTAHCTSHNAPLMYWNALLHTRPALHRHSSQLYSRLLYRQCCRVANVILSCLLAAEWMARIDPLFRRVEKLPDFTLDLKSVFFFLFIMCLFCVFLLFFHSLWFGVCSRYLE